MSEQVESLSSILGDTSFSKGEPAKADPAPPAVEQKAESPASEATATQAEPETKEPARDEAGRFAKSEAKPEVKEPTRADIAAIIDERRKRQELERKLQELTASKPKPDFWENPEKALEERVHEFVNPLRSENLQLQVEIARLKNSDFDDAMMAFLEAAEKDDVLKYQADNSPNPLQFIYREGKRIKELAPFGGDLTKRDEARFGELKGELSKRDEQIKLLSEQIESLKKSQAALESIPRSLNKGNESAPRSTAEADDDDIKSITRFGTNRG